MVAPAPLKTGLGLTLVGLNQAFMDARGTMREIFSIDRFDLAPGAHVCICGPSGAGKSSLLHVLAGIDRPQQGTVIWGQTRLSDLPEAARDQFRAQHMGFIFQDIHLIDGLSPIENVMVALRFHHLALPQGARARAEMLMARMGLDPASRAIETMSRGERQRLALARALMLNPEILLADEPTASLDSTSANAMAELLVNVATENGATLVIVTHDQKLVDRIPRVVDLINGQLVERAS